MGQWRRRLVAGCFFLALVYAGLWANAEWRPMRGMSMTIPIAPMRHVRLNIWKPVKDNTSFIAGGALAHEIDRPLTVIVWYYDARTADITRLSMVRVPAWPLLAIAGTSGIAAVWLWRMEQSPRTLRKEIQNEGVRG